MIENFRAFEVKDPFGRTWQVEFRWQQNAISIRHADAIDCKYYIQSGEEKRELVVALIHPLLIDLARRHNRPLTDAWCMRLAGLHLERLISTWEDMEKVIITPSPADLDAHNAALERAEAASLERQANSR